MVTLDDILHDKRMTLTELADRVGLTLFGPEPGLHLEPRKSSRHILRLIREVLAAPVEPGRSDLGAVLELAA